MKKQFIKCTGRNGHDVWVDIDEVIVVDGGPVCTNVLMRNGGSFSVQETPREVVERLIETWVS